MLQPSNVCSYEEGDRVPPRNQTLTETDTEAEVDSGVDDAARQILEVLRAERPADLVALRHVVDDLPIEASLLEATLWSLINDRTIELNPDRTISVTG